MNASPRTFRSLTAGALGVCALALGLVACGSDETTSSEEPAISNAEAITEIAAVQDGLDAALAAYEKGDAERAETLASDAYLEHFELVEGPLEEVNPDLNEQLEELIREDLRAAITSGADASEVSDLVDTAKTGLDDAKAQLQDSGAA